MNIGVVLGGGGARCLAHIGVLKALEEHGLSPAAFAACSTGALVAAFAAAGHRANEIRAIFEEHEVFGLMRPDFGPGLMNQDGVAALISDYLPETFAELHLPLAVVATDIQTGRLLILQKGALVSSVCASNAFPGLFSPIELHGCQLVDGGVLDNVPVDIIGALLSGEPVLAVDVSPSAQEKLTLETGGNPLERVLDKLTDQFTLPIALLRKAYTISQDLIIDFRLTAHPPDLLLRPEFPDGFGIMEFSRLDEAVELGYRTATQLLSEQGDKLERGK